MTHTKNDQMSQEIKRLQCVHPINRQRIFYPDSWVPGPGRRRKIHGLKITVCTRCGGFLAAGDYAT